MSDYSIPDIIEEVKTGIIHIVHMKDGERVSSGTGFMVSGYLVTNYHVIYDAPDHSTISLGTYHNDSVLELRRDKNGYFSGDTNKDNKNEKSDFIKKYSPKDKEDYIVLNIPELKNPDLFNFQLDSYKHKKVGEEILFIGYHFDHKYISSHRGFISSFYKSNNVDKIQLDASVNSGSSGSPLIDPNTSKVIGIITRKETGLSHDFNKVRETLGNTGTILEEYKQNIQSQDADFIQDQKHRKLEEQKKAVLSCQSYTDQIKAVKAINKNQNNMLELTKILSSSIEEVSKINDNLTNLTKEIERSANVGIGYAYSVEHFINQKLFN